METILQKRLIEGHLWPGHHCEYVSSEFNCRRISVVVHRSASHKLGVDALVCVGSLIPPRKVENKGFPRKEICVWQIVSSQRFVNDEVVSGKLSKCFYTCISMYYTVSPVLRLLTLSDQKLSFSLPVFRPGLKNPNMCSAPGGDQKMQHTCLHRQKLCYRCRD